MWGPRRLEHCGLACVHPATQRHHPGHSRFRRQAGEDLSVFGQNHTWKPPYCVWANPCLAATSLFERNHTGSRVEHEPEAENQV